MKIGDYVCVKNYPNYYSRRIAGEIVEIKKKKYQEDIVVIETVGDKEKMEFRMSELRRYYG